MISDIRLKIALFVLAAVVGIGVVWSYNHAIKKAERLEGELKQANLVIEGLEEKIKVTNIALRERQESENKLKKANDQYRQAFNRIKADDPKVNEWANRKLPSGVSSLLRESTGH